jgi:23S rRNA (adenine2503-C2)-methyltransferase
MQGPTIPALEQVTEKVSLGYAASPNGPSMKTIQDRLESLGAKPPHARSMLRAWLAGKPLGLHADARECPFPRRVIEALPAIERELDAIAGIVSRHEGEDGSSRLLLSLADGLTVESVLLPRDGLCVSTQVGCAVGCVFCWTGREGLLRNLESAEILAQIVIARRQRRVRRLVLSGMGEPSHNLPAVLEALSWLGSEGGFAHKLLVFSTVGDRKVFDRLASNDVRPALALSLHTTDATLREKLLPRAPRIPPEELVALAEAYARKTTWPIQYQWTLLEGINDGDGEVERLAELLRGKYAIVNFIPYNTVDGLDFRRPSVDRAREMSRALHRRGVLAKIRRSAGQDVEGACGQLRARNTVPGEFFRDPSRDAAFPSSSRL